MKNKRLLALLLAGALITQSGTALAANIDLGDEDVTEEIVLNDEDVEQASEPAAEPQKESAEEITEEDSVQAITVEDGTVVDSGTCGDNLTWTLDDAGTLTISGTGAMTDFETIFVVPWYSSCELIRTAVIGNGVTSIGKRALELCSNLESIAIPTSVTSIGEWAFYGCSSLENIEIPNSVTSIGERAFGSSNLKTITIPNSVKTIGENAFYKCNSLTDVIISEGVTSIGGWAFYECTNLQSITIPESVTSIGGWVFYGCRNLKSITIPESVVSIDEWVFCGCSSLKSITIKNKSCIIDDDPNTISETATIYGYIGSTAETYAKKYQREFIALVCADEEHKWDAGEVTKEADCKEEGERLYTCTVCGKTRTESIPKIAHVPSEAVRENEVAATCTKDGSYDEVVYCSVGKEELSRESKTVKALGHDYGDWATTKAATCTEKGTEQRVCKNDKTHVETREIEEIAHSPAAAVRENEVAATCTKDGSYDEVVYCADCGQELSRESKTVKALGHDYGDWETTKAATCTEKGNEQRVCKNDKTHVETREMEAIGHDYGEWTVTTEPTCTKAGVETRVCKNDKTHTETRALEATGHTWDSGKVTKAATCVATGIKTYTCKDCGATKTETIPATGKHTYKTTTTKAKPGKNGSTVTKCTVCGDVKSTTTISAPKTLTLSKTSYTYSGTAKKPTVTVEDAKGKKIASSNYTVSYASGRKNVGTYKVTVKFKGTKYTGSLTKSFTINPKATKIKQASNLVKGFKVTWSKTSNITGYQIQYSTSKSFKSVKTVTASKSVTSKKITGLKTGSISKKYYIRIRTYKTVNGKKYYSSWSAVKTAHAVRYSK